MKQCNSCKEILPLDNFRLVKRSNRNDEIYCKCRSCEKTYYRERRRSRSEVETLRTRGWRSRNPEKPRPLLRTGGQTVKKKLEDWILKDALGRDRRFLLGTRNEKFKSFTRGLLNLGGMLTT